MKQGLLITIDNKDGTDFEMVTTASDPALIRMLEACFKTDFTLHNSVEVKIHAIDLSLKIPEEEK